MVHCCGPSCVRSLAADVFCLRRCDASSESRRLAGCGISMSFDKCSRCQVRLHSSSIGKPHAMPTPSYWRSSRYSQPGTRPLTSRVQVVVGSRRMLDARSQLISICPGCGTTYLPERLAIRRTSPQPTGRQLEAESSHACFQQTASIRDGVRLLEADSPRSSFATAPERNPWNRAAGRQLAHLLNAASESLRHHRSSGKFQRNG